eukprot:tig00020964_g16785.t1
MPPLAVIYENENVNNSLPAPQQAEKVAALRQFTLKFDYNGAYELETPREPHGLHGQLQVEIFSGKGFEGTQNVVILFSVGDDEAETPVAARDPRGFYIFDQEHTFEIEPSSHPKLYLKVFDFDTRKRVGAIKMGYERMARRPIPQVERWIEVAGPREPGSSVSPAAGELHVAVRFVHYPDSANLAASSPPGSEDRYPLEPEPLSPAETSRAAPAPPSAAKPGYSRFLENPSKMTPRSSGLLDSRVISLPPAPPLGAEEEEEGGWRGWLARLACIPASWACWGPDGCLAPSKPGRGPLGAPTPLPRGVPSPPDTPRSTSLQLMSSPLSSFSSGSLPAARLPRLSG